MSTSEKGQPGTPAHIGFIGLGVMGYPMAGHLAAAGLELNCFDTDPAMRERMRDTWPKAGIADDVAAVGAGSDVVITMLPDGERVRQVALDTGGLIDSMAAGSILLDCSSAQPWLTLATARELAANDVKMVDAPVSGAQWGAEAAELVFMVGGADDDVERVRPLLDLLGRATFHVGPIGSGYRAADRDAGPGRSLSELVRWVEHLTGVEITSGGAARQDHIRFWSGGAGRADDR